MEHTTSVGSGVYVARGALRSKGRQEAKCEKYNSYGSLEKREASPNEN